MTGSFRRAHFDKHKNIQNDNTKIQQTNKINNLTNKQANKQTNKFPGTNIGVESGVISPPRLKQPI